MRPMIVLSFVVVALVSSACIGFRGPVDLEHDLAEATGAELERETGVTVGPLGVMLARWFTDEDEVPLRGVRKVQVGVYEVRKPGERELDARFPMPGWSRVALVREGDERVHVLVRERGEQIRGLLVVVAGDREWVVVRVRGRLERIVEEAMRMALDHAERPELAEPTIAAWEESQSAAAEPVEAHAATQAGRADTSG